MNIITCRSTPELIAAAISAPEEAPPIFPFKIKEALSFRHCATPTPYMPMNPAPLKVTAFTSSKDKTGAGDSPLSDSGFS